MLKENNVAYLIQSIPTLGMLQTLFEQAIAVVVDSGAAASHAAIVAREYGFRQ